MKSQPLTSTMIRTGTDCHSAERAKEFGLLRDAKHGLPAPEPN